jgi:hypothetical protein
MKRILALCQIPFIADEHPSLVAPLSNLALSYPKLGRFNDAELTLRHANTICGKTLGADHATCGALLEGYDFDSVEKAREH